MNSYAYEAVNASGRKMSGSIEVDTQAEALRRIKEMGLYPTRVSECKRRPVNQKKSSGVSWKRVRNFSINIPFFSSRVKPSAVTILTRQLATLVEAGMPLLRGLRILQQQEANPALKRILEEVGSSIESGSSLSEALSAHPKVFNRLYLNMTRAGELGGVLEITLRRLAEFMEKAQRIKGKIKSAMFYPVAVLFVAAAVLGAMTIYVIPKFQEVFQGLLPGQAMPVFTVFILRISEMIRGHAPWVALGAGGGIMLFTLALRTDVGRLAFDQFKLKMPILGNLFRKASIARFARTLGTLLASGVPVLQALTIVKETAGNAVVGKLVSRVHECVKEGDTITLPLKSSRVFPPMIVGMVDVGEQTGALPDMLLKIADNCEEEVDDAVNGLTSLLEPLLIIFLAVVVGSIVIAMFLPILAIMDQGIKTDSGLE